MIFNAHSWFQGELKAHQTSYVIPYHTVYSAVLYETSEHKINFQLRKIWHYVPELEATFFLYHLNTLKRSVTLSLESVLAAFHSCFIWSLLLKTRQNAKHLGASEDGARIIMVILKTCWTFGWEQAPQLSTLSFVFFLWEKQAHQQNVFIFIGLGFFLFFLMNWLCKDPLPHSSTQNTQNNSIRLGTHHGLE